MNSNKYINNDTIRNITNTFGNLSSLHKLTILLESASDIDQDVVNSFIESFGENVNLNYNIGGIQNE